MGILPLFVCLVCFAPICPSGLWLSKGKAARLIVPSAWMDDALSHQLAGELSPLAKC
jgi:hypothetical protein